MVERQVVGWFDVAEPERFQPDNFPIFVIRSERGDYYGAEPSPDLLQSYPLCFRSEQGRLLRSDFLRKEARYLPFSASAATSESAAVTPYTFAPAGSSPKGTHRVRRTV